MLKALEPIVSAVLLVSIVLVASAAVSIWYIGFVNKTVKGEAAGITESIECGQAGIDFDSARGRGIRWDFSGPRTGDYLDVWLSNTGSVNLYGFSFEVLAEQNGNLEIFIFSPENDATIVNPLKPGQSRLFRAKMTDDVSGMMKSIRVLNSICRKLVIEKVF
ncbi:MAG: hypothetical protein HYX24_00040 [Candidatus Aenigmarchaeota archaeon]|nr:hypothetical protein [Candidatus Aenigmarchaeota archaeon]